MGKVNRIAGCLNETIWYNQYLRRETKIRIYKCVIGRILTYTAKTGSETTRMCQLEAAVKKVWSKISKLTTRDHIRHKFLHIM